MQQKQTFFQNWKRNAAISVVFLFLLILTVASASSNVSVPETINVTITVGGSSVTLNLVGGSLLDELIVNASSLEITKGASGGVTVVSNDKIQLLNDQGLETKCESGLSKLEITTNTKVIITPTSTAVYCSNPTTGLSGGSTGSSPSTPTTTTTSPTSNAGTTPPQGTGTTTMTTPPKRFAAVDFKDLGKLKSSARTPIEQMVDYMLNQKTYAFPPNQLFKYRNVTDATFGLRIAAALSEKCCSAEKEYPGFSKLRASAEAAGIIDKSFKSKAKLTRIEFYEYLLKALGVPMVKATVKDLEKVCDDLKAPTDETASIFLTAKKYNIASRYSGKKCMLHMQFSKTEAAKWGSRALTTKKVLDAAKAK